LILCHYFPPEIGAPQARLSEMASVWLKSGFDITVVTCLPNHPTGIIYDGYKDLDYKIEYINNIKIVRCKTYATPNEGFIKKLIGHLVFMFSSVLQAGKYAKYSDIVLVSSPTFFSVISAYFLSKKYKKPYIFEVRDLWPAIFIELGIIKNKFLLIVLEKLEIFLYENAAKIVTVTESFKRNIINRGIPKEKVITITNGVNPQFFKPRKRDLNFIKKFSVENKFVVLYTGAHGISHSLEKILEVSYKMKGNRKIHFLFVGDGAEKKPLQDIVKNKNLLNVSFFPAQKKEDMPYIYSVADVILVPLKNLKLFDTFIPSKIFEIMAMGKPIIASVKGESAKILNHSRGALLCDPEDVDGISGHIETLFKNNNLKETLGKNGLIFVNKFYNRDRLAHKYEKLFNNIIYDI